MKPCLFVLALLFSFRVCRRSRGCPGPCAPAAGGTYQQFLDQMVTPENLTDCIAKMDILIDAAEHLSEVSESGSQGLDAETKIGLHLSFRIVRNEAAVVYYLVTSRNGQELAFADATKLAALFGDRAGLPHPVAITEGEKPVFYAEWLIKHSDWKSMKKMMVKVRAENRSEKDPRRAFVIAIILAKPMPGKPSRPTPGRRAVWQRINLPICHSEPCEEFPRFDSVGSFASLLDDNASCGLYAGTPIAKLINSLRFH